MEAQRADVARERFVLIVAYKRRRRRPCRRRRRRSCLGPCLREANNKTDMLAWSR